MKDKLKTDIESEINMPTLLPGIVASKGIKKNRVTQCLDIILSECGLNYKQK